jgi:GNAT superfamily N-acetyltransferase
MIKLKKKDINKAAFSLANAFKNEAHILYYFPQDRYNFKHILEFFKFRVKNGILFGEVYATSKNFEGIAIWIYDKKNELNITRILRSGGLKLLFKSGKKAISKMNLVASITKELYKKNAVIPYMTLTAIGVKPEHQQKGYSKLLINNMLHKLDKKGIPCYLETTTKKNIKIYEKYGFQTIDKIVIPNTSIPIYLMFRKYK